MITVLIDRTNMAFLAKHEDRRALAFLGFLEYPHLAQAQMPCEMPSDFNMLSDLELRLLFKHTTGHDHSNAQRRSLLTSCVALAQQLPLTTGLNVFELEVQANSIAPGDEERYRYVPGASRPMLVTELFEVQPLRCEQRWTPEQLAELSKKGPAQAAIAPAAATVPSAPRSPAARPAAPSAPRGSSKPLIWERMDRIWDKAGKPTSIQIVLGLRKACMSELEHECGIKRTTSSTELGNWMKARVPQ
jgi:hypothetical protein